LAAFTALFDANVLYAVPVTDIVMELASTGLFRALWSDDIHDEWVCNVAKNRPDLPKAVIERRRANMERALPQARVDGYHGLIAGLVLPDPNDRHVLAAAIVGRADVIVTYDLGDFPARDVERYGIEVQHPDEFLNHQRTLNEALFLQAIKSIRERLTKPRYDAETYIANLRKNHLQVIAGELDKVRGLI
jgi:predicted nucleic acid-binding protein